MKLDIESDIRPFLYKLQECSRKSSFDDNFLRLYTAETLYGFDRKQWLSLYKERRSELRDTTFSWTRQNRSVNRIWLDNAQKVGLVFSVDIVDLIFPDELIDPKDKDFIKRDYDFVDLYTDDKGQLRSFCRFVSSYESGNEPYDTSYKLSLYEAEQIKSKCVWKYFSENIIPIWHDDAQSDMFKDCVYPLFACVTTYFSMIENLDSADIISIKDLLAEIYYKELIYLDRPIVYAFFALKIHMGTDSQMTMLETLLACRGSHTLSGMHPYMIAWASWIGNQNPAMIIKHPALDTVYQSLGIGSYCTRQRLLSEVDKLLLPKYSSELDNKIRLLVVNLSSLLSQNTTTDESIFNAMKMLNLKFDIYNGRPKNTTSPSRRHAVATNDYVYNQKGINAQIIFINQLLSGWGFLERHGIACYYRFMMDLKSDTDPISLKLYSQFPLSHCVRPHDDRGYLAVLDNSVDYFRVTEGVFENVNAKPQRPFTEEEYSDIQRFSAVQFRNVKYKRIAEYPVPPIKKSYLLMFTYLVNMSLNFKGLIDGYRFETVWDFPEECEHKDDVIYVKIGRAFLQYSVKDRWTINNRKQVHKGIIPTHDDKSKSSFFDLIRDEDKIRYMLGYTGQSQHTRPNYPEEQLTRSVLAYTQVKQKIDEIPDSDKVALYSTRIRMGNQVITIGELWADGFPECMTYASKGFAILLTIYYGGNIQFDKRLEEESVTIGDNFFEEQRKLAKTRNVRPEIIDDTNVVSLSNVGFFKKTFSRELLELVIIPEGSTDCKMLSTASTREGSLDISLISETSNEDGHVRPILDHIDPYGVLQQQSKK